MNQVKIGLIEDQRLFREGIKSLINAHPKINVVFESPDGFSVLERLEKSEEIPDVMLIDLTLPRNGNTEYSGWRVLSELNRHYPNMRKLILSIHNDPYVIVKIIEEGAHGFLAKDVDPEEVYRGILQIYEHGSYINELALDAIQKKLMGKLKTPKSHEGLTKREMDIIRLIPLGKTTKDIAEELFISEKTVNGHRNNILQKTGANNAAGLVMYAVKHGLVELT